jgi:hypothetical protein
MVTLTTWHHVIEGIDPKSLTAELTNLEGVDMVLTDPLRARAGLARREYLMYVIRADGEVFAARIEVARRDLQEQNRLLNALVDTYKDRGQVHRVMSEELEEVKGLYPGMAGLVIFPQYDTSEVLELAQEGELLPAGLTRHLIQGRALRINYPLSELRSGRAWERRTPG